MHALLTAAAIALLVGAALNTPAVAQSSESSIWGNQPFGFDTTTPSQPKKRKFRARSVKPSTAAALDDPPLPEPNPARLASDRGTETAASGTATGTATDASPVETGTVSAPVDTGPVPCRKYDPTTARTIEVRCR